MKLKIFIITFLVSTLFYITGCSKKNESNSTPSNSFQKIETFTSKPNKETTKKSEFEHKFSDKDKYHSDSRYKYKYRTGQSRNYDYNYDVNGTDENGNSVSGNIDISGKYGTGYIEDEEGNEKEIDVEWIDYGQLEATDEDGNTYELEVDE